MSAQRSPASAIRRKGRRHRGAGEAELLRRWGGAATAGYCCQNAGLGHAICRRERAWLNSSGTAENETRGSPKSGTRRLDDVFASLVLLLEVIFAGKRLLLKAEPALALDWPNAL